MSNRTLKALSAAVISMATVGTAQAALEEVIVTATKRAESTQNIPLSIETVSGDAMDSMGITDFGELADTIPNLSIGYGITTEVISIRGLGSGSERSFEQSVGMFIDGFYAPRSRQYQSPFLDVARVEIARGPQSAIHGLNSTAGAISVVTNKTQPGDAAFFDITADYEFEYGGPSVVAIAGGSLGDRFGVRLALKQSDRDGFFENSFTGEDEGDTEETLARLSAVWAITDSVSLSMKYENAKREMEGNTGELFAFPGGADLEPNDNQLNWARSSNGCQNDPNGFLPALATPGIYPDTCPGQETDSTTFVANLDWEANGGTLSVMLGHSEFDYDITVDLDTSSASFVDSGIFEEFEQDAFEVRWTSEQGRTVDYIVGAYYHDWSNFNSNPATFGPGTLGGLLSGAGPVFPVDAAIETSGTFDQESQVMSLFTQVTWNINDSVALTGGLRYTDEDKESTYGVVCNLVLLPTGDRLPQDLPGPLGLCNSNPATDGLNVSRSSDNWLPELAIQWDVNDHAMLYAKWSESAKSGGFTSAQRNPAADWTPADQEYQDEEASGFEIGFKSRWADDTFELNGAIYRTEFDDLQVNTFTPVGAVIVQNVTNAAKAISEGIELDARWAASEAWELGASLAFINAEYDRFVNGTCTIASGLPSPCNQSGDPLPGAADMSGNVYADVTLPLTANINFNMNLNLSYSDDYFTAQSNEPVSKQDSWVRLAARVGIEAADQRWSVALIGRNLTDEEVLSTSQSFLHPTLDPTLPTMLGYLEPPRTIMIQGSYRFGGL